MRIRVVSTLALALVFGHAHFPLNRLAVVQSFNASRYLLFLPPAFAAA